MVSDSNTNSFKNVDTCPLQDALSNHHHHRRGPSFLDLFHRGWDYVNCMESIVRADGFDNNKDCWKLTTFCRDVLKTPSMDEYGRGITPSTFQHKGGTSGLLFGILGGVLLASILMLVVAFRDRFHKQQRGGNKYGIYDGEVQFCEVRTHEEMID